MKMDSLRFLKRFTQAGRPGTYLRIVEAGELAPGDPVQIVATRTAPRCASWPASPR